MVNIDYIVNKLKELEQEQKDARRRVDALLQLLVARGVLPPTPSGHYYAAFNSEPPAKTVRITLIGPDWGHCHTQEDHVKICENCDEEDSEGPMLKPGECIMGHTICTHPEFEDLELPDPDLKLKLF